MRLARVAVPVILAIAILIALGRVAATWDVYTPTFDEPAHFAAGMEWLDRGQYRYEEMHPPLARVAVALGPYLDGYRSEGRPGIWAEGNAILHQRRHPARALALARAGILPFLVLAIVVVFLWARSLGGATVGVLAVLAFTWVPPVLAHAGLATTDEAAMATVALTIFALVRWLERPGLAATCGLGVAAGLALLAKMSAVVFLPAAAVAVLLAWKSGGNRVLPYTGRAVLAGAVALLTLWAGYRFSVGPINRGPLAGQTAVERAAGQPPRDAPDPPGSRTLKRRLARLASLPVYPAPEYWRGIYHVRRENRQGRRNVLLGEVIRDGRWYFFPVALGVKTPIPFLLLTAVGGATLLGMGRHRRSALVPVLAAAAVLAAAMAANINIGVRHVLPIYPMLGICAGLGALRLWHFRRLRLAGPALAVALGLWLAVESVRAHPDYLPYFNQLAGEPHETVLLDSDLDWGQDLGRLADTLRAREVSRIWLAYHGKVNLAGYGLPSFRELPPDTRVTGWVAASAYRLRMGFMGGTHDPFAWLLERTPVARVGHSIYLYHIEPDTAAGTRRR